MGVGGESFWLDGDQWGSVGVSGGRWGCEWGSMGVSGGRWGEWGSVGMGARFSKARNIIRASLWVLCVPKISLCVESSHDFLLILWKTRLYLQ